MIKTRLYIFFFALVASLCIVAIQANALTFNIDNINIVKGSALYGSIAIIDNGTNVDSTVILNDPLRWVNVLSLNWNTAQYDALPAAFGKNIGANSITVGEDNVKVNQAFDIRILDQVGGNSLTFTLQRGNEANIDPESFFVRIQSVLWSSKDKSSTW